MIGYRFSNYEITAKLGKGGMGEVWEAVDRELDRKVAVKTLPAQMADDRRWLQRFQREAKAIASLNHPSIVTIHAVEEADGHRLLVMELVEGETLERKLSGAGLPVDEVIALAIPIADALAAAHDKGIVHRDIKAGNVMVTGDGQVKLLDFGLAKLLEPEAGDAPVSDEEPTRAGPLTAEGVVLGTVPYMSPEQIRGQKIDARSDVFSLGVLLYEMVAGARPFHGNSGLDVLSSILRDSPPPITATRPDVPRHLSRIIESCLKKDPADRYQSARDVRNQLAVLKGEIESASAYSHPVAMRANRRSRGWLAAASVVAALGIGGYWLAGNDGLAGGSGLLGAAPPEQPSASTAPPTSAPLADVLDDGRLMLAVLPFENIGAAQDEYFAAGLSEEIRSRLAVLDGLGVISRTTARQFRGNPISYAEVARELRVDYLLEGTLRWQPGAGSERTVRVSPQLIDTSRSVQVWTASYTVAPTDIFDVQAEIAQRVAEELDLQILEPHRRVLSARYTENVDAYDTYLRAEELFERGKEIESRDEIVAGIELYEQAVAGDPEFSIAWARLGEANAFLCFYRLDCNDERIEAGRAGAARALELMPDLPDAHYAKGLAHFAAGETAAATAQYELVKQRWPNYSQAFWGLSLYHTVTGEWDEALANAIKAADLNPRASRHHCQVGGMNIARGNYDAAIAHHQRAIQLTPERACPYYCLIEATVSAGDVGRARRLLAEIPDDVSFEESPSIGYHSVRLDVMEGRYDEALARLAAGPADAYVAAWMYVPKSLLLAQILELQGRVDEAGLEYDSARLHLEPLVGERPFDTRYRGALAIAYAGLGRRDDALRQEDTALPLLEGGGMAKPWALRQFAHARVLLGDHDEAVAFLRQHLEFSSYMGAGYLELYPTWNPLREREDFRALIEEHRSS